MNFPAGEKYAKSYDNTGVSVSMLKQCECEPPSPYFSFHCSLDMLVGPLASSILPSRYQAPEIIAKFQH
jgi:hypothetical protein